MDSRSPVMMTGQIFFSPDKPRFWPVKLMNIIITLLPMEYRITLAVRHCRSSFCRQVGEKFIHTFLSSLSTIFARFHIPWVSSYGGVWNPQGSSHICISVKLYLFRCPARERKSPLQRRTTLNIFGKEVYLGQIRSTNSVFIIRSQ